MKQTRKRLIGVPSPRISTTDTSNAILFLSKKIHPLLQLIENSEIISVLGNLKVYLNEHDENIEAC